MRAFYKNILNSAYNSAYRAVFENQFPVFNKYALFQLLFPREKHRLCFYLFRHGANRRIVIVKHRKIIRRLIHKYAPFGLDISLHAAVTVKMIRRDIKQRRNARMKLLNALKLIAAYLGNHSVLRRCIKCISGIRNADIPHHIIFSSRVPEHLSRKRGRCGFPVGPRYRNRNSFAKAVSQFNFRKHRNIPPPRFFKRRNIRRHARAYNNQFLTVKQTVGLAAQLKKAFLLKRFQPLQLLLRL